ncbi:hypothetical protein [Actinomadura sp. 9N407]|uniref:hypothetical protein n=1 Tax=Actinomadura sp. 9N407 TaxID=3375154 RepID=UPI0037B914D3
MTSLIDYEITQACAAATPGSPPSPPWILLGEIKAMGYQGGSRPLYRYLDQVAPTASIPPPLPRRLAG